MCKDDDLLKQKAALRQEMSQIRDSLTIENRKSQEEKVLGFLQDRDFLDLYETVYLYVSFRSEFPTGNILKLLWDMKKNVLLPRVEISGEKTKTNKEMDFYPVDSMLCLKKGYMGILEPKDGTPVLVPGLMLVPGLAFDQYGGRLGYGGGFYDAFLLKAESENIKIDARGLCFNEQVIPRVPMEKKDIKIHGILSAAVI